MARKRKSRKAVARAEAARMGPDPSGNYGVNPFTARGHIIEVAPKDLRSSATSEQWPKRNTTQNMIGRYFKHGHITESERKAADALLELWNDAGNEARVTSGYEPVIMSSPANMDARVARRIDAARAFLELMKLVPYRSQGVVKAVVILDWSASDWAHTRGIGERDSKAMGLRRLRAGLQALARFLGY